MATPMNTTQFRDTFEPVLIDKYELIASRLPTEWDKFVEVTKGRKLGIENQVMQFGLGVAQVKPQGAPIAYASGGQSYKSTFIKVTYGIAFALTEEAMEFNELQDLLDQYSKELPVAINEAQELVCAAVINNAFSNSYLGGDSVPFASLLHPIQGGTYSNKLSAGADLSEAAVEQLQIQIRTAVDENNRPMSLHPVNLECAPANEFTACRILRSDYTPGSANNAVNATKVLGRLSSTPVVITRMTNTRQFQISTDADIGLQWKYGWKPRTKFEGDFESGNMRAKSTFNGACTWTNPRTKFFSQGGGS